MVDTIKFSEFLDGGDLSNDETTVGLGGGSNTRFNNPWTFLKPGSTGDRPIPVPGMYYRLRFNTSFEIYEYYDPTIPLWTPLSGSGTGTVNPGVANDMAYYAASGQAVSPIPGAVNSVLVTNGSKVPSLSTTFPVGLTVPGATITSSTAALTAGSVISAPVSANDLTNKSYVDTLVSGTVTSITGTLNQVIVSSPTGAVTLSLPQNIAVGSTPTFAGLTLSSIPLSISSGGTGVNSVTTVPTASSFAGWDINKNLSANSHIPAIVDITSSGGNTVLTVSSAMIQHVIGTLTHTITLPVVSTLVAGQPYQVINNSTSNVTVNSSGGNVIQVMASNTTLYLNCILTSGTTAASWNSTYAFNNGAGVSSITGTANQVIASASTGAITLSLPQSIASTSSPTFAALTLTNPYIAGAGGLHSVQVFTSGTGATYTKPANVTSIFVEVIGGGGGGGGSSAGVSSQGCAGGGGGGGYACLFVASAAASYTYTVGAGGAGGTTAPAAGTNGGTTTFSASSLQATGGTGGAAGGSVALTSNASTTDSAAGLGSNGIINSAGTPGIGGLYLTSGGRSGSGGATMYGGGARGLTVNSTGLAAPGYGGGGSGSYSSASSSNAGGAGSSGLIVVWEFA